jgi:hypothetical protein
MSDTKNESMTAGNVVGFQVPMGIKKRKRNVDEVLQLNPDITEGHALFFLASLSEEQSRGIEEALDTGDYNHVAGEMRAHAIREFVRKKIAEIVRKKKGGGGYVLYAPNTGKKKAAKPVGEFPTKFGAKRAELSRFPPKDIDKLKKARKELDRVRKDPDKMKKKLKREGTEAILVSLISEALFREEDAGSDWDENIGKLSRAAVSNDKKLQAHQKSIEKKTEAVLSAAVMTIKRALGKDAKLKSFGGVKKSDSGKTYVAFGVQLDAIDIEPIYVYVENGKPRIEISSQAKVSLTKAEPDQAKMLRAELATVQERVLDREDSLTKAVDVRDKYLTKVQDTLDKIVAGFSPLEVSMLKNLLVRKYRKI